MDLISFIGVSVYSRVKSLRSRLKGLDGPQFRSGSSSSSSSRDENITLRLPGIESNPSVLYS